MRTGGTGPSLLLALSRVSLMDNRASLILRFERVLLGVAGGSLLCFAFLGSWLACIVGLLAVFAAEGCRLELVRRMGAARVAVEGRQ